MVLDEDTGEVTQRDERRIHERRVEGNSSRQECSHLSEADTVIPDVEGTFALNLTHHAVRGAGEVMRHLENVGNPFGNRD